MNIEELSQEQKKLLAKIDFKELAKIQKFIADHSEDMATRKNNPNMKPFGQLSKEDREISITMMQEYTEAPYPSRPDRIEEIKELIEKIKRNDDLSNKEIIAIQEFWPSPYLKKRLKEIEEAKNKKGFYAGKLAVDTVSKLKTIDKALLDIRKDRTAYKLFNYLLEAIYNQSPKVDFKQAMDKAKGWKVIHIGQEITEKEDGKAWVDFKERYHCIKVQIMAADACKEIWGKKGGKNYTMLVDAIDTLASKATLYRKGEDTYRLPLIKECRAKIPNMGDGNGNPTIYTSEAWKKELAKQARNGKRIIYTLLLNPLMASWLKRGMRLPNNPNKQRRLAYGHSRWPSIFDEMLAFVYDQKEVCKKKEFVEFKVETLLKRYGRLSEYHKDKKNKGQTMQHIKRAFLKSKSPGLWITEIKQKYPSEGPITLDTVLCFKVEYPSTTASVDASEGQ